MALNAWKGRWVSFSSVEKKKEGEGQEGRVGQEKGLEGDGDEEEWSTRRTQGGHAKKKNEASLERSARGGAGETEPSQGRNKVKKKGKAIGDRRGKKSSY